MVFLTWAVLGVANHADKGARALLLPAPSLGRTSLHSIPAANLLFMAIIVQQKRMPARWALPGAGCQGAGSGPWGGSCAGTGNCGCGPRLRGGTVSCVGLGTVGSRP
jgi:hypothetical protein